jgi:hypothetical protein
MTNETKKRGVILAYEIWRGYGGPEEGGWWYDAKAVLALRRARGKKRNRRVRREMRRRFAHLDDGLPLSSVLSTGRVRIHTTKLTAHAARAMFHRPGRPQYE